MTEQKIACALSAKSLGESGTNAETIDIIDGSEIDADVPIVFAQADGSSKQIFVSSDALTVHGSTGDIKSSGSFYSGGVIVPTVSSADTLTNKTIGAASIFYEGTSRTNSTTADVWFNRTFYAVDFDVVADGITDNTAAIESMAVRVDNLGGGTIIYPSGVICLTNRVDIDNLTNPQRHKGAGAAVTRFRFLSGDYIRSSMFEVTNSAFFEFTDATLDCNYSVVGSGGHGISALNCSNTFFDKIQVLDWLNAAIIVYTDFPGIYTGGRMQNCVGYSASASANNGFSFEDMWGATYENVTAIGARGGPGYGIQYKNNCRNGSAVNVLAINCSAGIAFGQTDGVGAQNMQVQGIAIGCNLGLAAGYMVGCNIDIVCDMQLQGLEAIYLSNYCRLNTIRVSAYNVSRSVNAVRIGAGDRNDIIMQIITGGNSQLVRFAAGTSYNTVTIGRASFYDANKIITGFTKANPGVGTTSVAHGMSVGDHLYIQNVGGMTQLNGNYYLVNSVPTTTSFTLKKLSGAALNTTDFDSYTSGGIIARQSTPTAITAASITNDQSGGYTNQVLFNDTLLYSQSVPNLVVASAAALDLTSENTKCPSITGTTTITSITMPEGSLRFVKFSGVLTLTNGNNLIIPGGNNIVTASGDTALFVAESATVVRCHYYQRSAAKINQASVASGAAVSVLNNTVTVITSVTLPAGDYLITANPAFITAGITATSLQSFLATDPGTSTTGRDTYNTAFINPPDVAANTTLSSNISVPVSVPAGGATYYLKVLAAFSAGTLTAFGGLSAIKS